MIAGKAATANSTTQAASAETAVAPEQRPSYEDVLRELVRIRKVRAKKHVPYEEDRELKKAERTAWDWAEELVDPQPKKVDPVDRAAAERRAKAEAKRAAQRLPAK